MVIDPDVAAVAIVASKVRWLEPSCLTTGLLVLLAGPVRHRPAVTFVMPEWSQHHFHRWDRVGGSNLHTGSVSAWRAAS